jgi:aminopeptidase
MTQDFEKLLGSYADLIVHIGLNVRAGQKLLVRAPIQSAPVVHKVTESAYRAGARLVDVLYGDENLTLARFEHAPRDSFEEFPVWRANLIEEYAANGDAILSIYAENPDLLKDQDRSLVSLTYNTASKHSQGYLQYIQRNAMNWCVVSVPIPSWAGKVFPDAATGKCEEKLWDAIFEVTRLKMDDPIAAWKDHVEQLEKRSVYLNNKQYHELHYQGPGTDLRLGLPEGHIWVSGRNQAQNGISFIANLPTEEIFTLPHRERAEGVVSSTRPLPHGGNLIEDFSLTFENGRVVKATAARGEELLQKMIETDEGAARLGEIALLPNSSPISQSGILFYNTLFDENAASHLALGNAYQFTLRGGANMDTGAFMAAGGNHSLIHEDFMIGSGRLSIDGISQDGTVEPVMRDGEWAFDV